MKGVSMIVKKEEKKMRDGDGDVNEVVCNANGSRVGSY